ncbi:Tlg2-vesicle protein [Steccherinum ochraceum]|uniref:Golgi apparatus membrane protein TVP38 n=1 Tax=Steccherinum ochraceum TaxID=92696 RepID=A0A4R0RC38_9APHY|nr:Tlg2-vesicle protein [Steccherinum ochraceum]
MSLDVAAVARGKLGSSWNIDIKSPFINSLQLTNYPSLTTVVLDDVHDILLDDTKSTISMSGPSPYRGYASPYARADTHSPYPPPSGYDASSVTLGRNSFQEHDTAPLKPEPKDGAFTVDMRGISRTPSPTPSEQAELNKKGLIDWQAMKNWRFWLRKEWFWYYVIGIIVTVLFALITIFHEQIVHWLQPAANWMHDLPAGFLIPIAIFFVISFPPLFGHEIVAILCGVVWGLWIGFAITAAGTFLGEIGNFYAFKWCCHARAEKMEKKDISYATLARVIRDGGFKVALIARYSAIPGHFTTAVFATCGMGFWTFALAALLSLPKQFVTVYLGVALEQSTDGQPSKKDQIIKWSILVLTTVVTIGAMWYISKRMLAVKPDVIYARRKARQQKMTAAPYGNGAYATFNPNASESDLPLNPKSDGVHEHQQWDSSGRAVGYAGDPSLYAPQPQRAKPFGSNAAASSSNVQLAPPSSAPRFSSPQRQDTAQSWDGQATVGTQDVYKMTRQQSPSADPFASGPLPPKLPPPTTAPIPQSYSHPGSQPHYTSPQLPPPPPGAAPAQNLYNPFDDSHAPPPGLSSQHTTPPPLPSQRQYPAYSPPKYDESARR